ncbi:MAG: hypothetical protein U0N09_02535, partial [Alistipes dispar]
MHTPLPPLRQGCIHKNGSVVETYMAAMSVPIAPATTIKIISAIHDITNPAIAKPRGTRKMPTNEKINPNSHNTQPKPGIQLKINPSKAN